MDNRLNVEAMRDELRQLFPETYIVIRPLEIHLSPHDTSKSEKTFGGYSLTEVMQKVREWKAKQ